MKAYKAKISESLRNINAKPKTKVEVHLNPVGVKNLDLKVTLISVPNVWTQYLINRIYLV